MFIITSIDLAPGNIISILKYLERLAGLHPDFATQPLAELAQAAILMRIVHAHIAHERYRIVTQEASPLPLGFRDQSTGKTRHYQQ
jgi:hypothetical protein